MDVRISRGLLDAILATQVPDREVCGLLFGLPGRIEAAEPADNVAVMPATRFEIDPAALFAAIRAEREGGRPLAGHYHSHPSGRPEPSARDAAQALCPGRLWLILAGAEVGLWRERPGGPVQGAFEAARLVVEERLSG